MHLIIKFAKENIEIENSNNSKREKIECKKGKAHLQAMQQHQMKLCNVYDYYIIIYNVIYNILS